MATVLAISSQVVRGAVGNSASGFALQRMGHTVLQLPTVLLSNHPGHGEVAGSATNDDMYTAIWRTIVGHGWHCDIDAILTGYMPSEAIAHATAEIVREVQAVRDDVIYLCDPAIGDEPNGLYVPPAAATAVREALLPLAGLATPNRFELTWLSGCDAIQCLHDVVCAARSLNMPTVVTTSVPAPDETAHIANVLSAQDMALSCSTQRLETVPKGTGDLFGALYLGSVVDGHSAAHALGFATAVVRDVLTASKGYDSLQSVASQKVWENVAPLPAQTIAP